MRISFSSSGLKIVAMATMLADHVGFLFFPDQTVWRIVGRLSFPLFAFLVAEGERKTGNQRNYLFRLLTFAVISQIPYMFFLSAGGVSPEGQNIFFTLAAGLLALLLIKKWPPVASLPAVLFICAASEFFRFDYGVYGILTILASSLFLARPGAPSALPLLFLPLAQTLVTFQGGGLPIQFFAFASVPFVLSYNGTRGRVYFGRLFYWFYPAHFALLGGMWYLCNM